MSGERVDGPAFVVVVGVVVVVVAFGTVDWTVGGGVVALLVVGI